MLTIFVFCYFIAATAAFQTLSPPAQNGTASNYSFTVDYENDQFLLDGKPFRYVSGSFHYFRAPKQFWRDRLRKMREGGLNAVSTYVEWSLHQPEPNVWRWDGDADLVEFLTIAEEEDLFVLLRPGPYICAERDLGGLPYWLLSLVPDIQLRTNDTRYMKYVEIYLKELFPKIEPFLRGNGGPIIMVQVENEYGSYYACDRSYLNRLVDLFRQKIGNKALLYTTDGNTAKAVRCGKIPGAYATVDFGTSANITQSFQVMRLFEPKGPLVNSEFYSGWLTHWEENLQTVNTSAVIRSLDEILSLGASVNIYMFYGGTNFAFTSGANGGTDSFQPQLTSYDYDAPLTEAGDLTDKYYSIRQVIAKYLPVPNITHAAVSPKGNYGSVLMKPVVGLLDSTGRSLFGSASTISVDPPSFEALRINHWMVLYETTLPNSGLDPALLSADVRDRALVYVEDNPAAGILSRTRGISSMPLEDCYGKTLRILVENQGHLNFGDYIRDFKGLWNVTLNGEELSPWNVTKFRVDDVLPLDRLPEIPQNSSNFGETLTSGPVFLRGNFSVTGTPRDTYLDTSGWGKGVAFINGQNLGRYWPLGGPQVTLYVPATFLKPGSNELVVLELERIPAARKLKFQINANLGANFY